MHTKTYTANYHDAFQKKNMENQNNMEPNTTRKTLLEHGVFWPNIYTNFVIDFVKPGNENSLPYSLFGLIEECTEFVQLIEKPDNSEELLLEAGDILYYAVLTSKNLRKNDPDTDPWPNFFLIDDSSKEKGIEFNEYAKNQMLLDIQKLAKLGTKVYKLEENHYGDYKTFVHLIISSLVKIVTQKTQCNLLYIAEKNIEKLINRANLSVSKWS
jgi:hypothetical protein